MGRHLVPVRRQRDRLAMVAARGRDQSWQTVHITKELCRIDDRCARLERPDWGVVLVFDPHFATQTLTQQRPNELRSGWHNLIHELLRLFNFINRWQTRFLKDFCSHRSPLPALLTIMPRLSRNQAFAFAVCLLEARRLSTHSGRDHKLLGTYQRSCPRLTEFRYIAPSGDERGQSRESFTVTNRMFRGHF